MAQGSKARQGKGEGFGCEWVCWSFHGLHSRQSQVLKAAQESDEDVEEAAAAEVEEEVVTEEEG